MCRRGRGKGNTGELLISLTAKGGTENVPTDVFCQSFYKNKIRSIAKDSENSGISLTDRA